MNFLFTHTHAANERAEKLKTMPLNELSDFLLKSSAQQVHNTYSETIKEKRQRIIGILKGMIILSTIVTNYNYYLNNTYKKLNFLKF